MLFSAMRATLFLGWYECSADRISVLNGGLDRLSLVLFWLITVFEWLYLTLVSHLDEKWEKRSIERSKIILSFLVSACTPMKYYDLAWFRVSTCLGNGEQYDNYQGTPIMTVVNFLKGFEKGDRTSWFILYLTRTFLLKAVVHRLSRKTLSNSKGADWGIIIMSRGRVMATPVAIGDVVIKFRGGEITTATLSNGQR